MEKSASSSDDGSPSNTVGSSAEAPADNGKSVAGKQTENVAGLSEKQLMVEKLFRHTNQFLEAHKQDPLLVVEALAAILVRYTALLGPVDQMNDRLEVLERLIGLESNQIREIAKPAEPTPKP